MKQTAVEWLIHQMLEASINKETEEMYIKLPKDALKQAKEIEKHQIKDAWINSLTKGDYNSAEEYYKQTFKSE